MNNFTFNNYKNNSKIKLGMETSTIYDFSKLLVPKALSLNAIAINRNSETFS